MQMKFLILLVVLLIAGCIHIPSPLERSDQAQQIAAQAGWKKELIATDDFTLLAYMPAISGSSKTLTIYIEGDGLAWISSSTPSSDPTPTNPLALKLALRDPAPSVYLARPCQYVGAEQQANCAQKYWTSHRFSPEIIRSTSQAIDKIKLQFGAERLILVGYSGGGAVAALVAAQRVDVARLITIAGNLDHRAWTSEYFLTPLSGSLNPADAWQQLSHIPQKHYVGGKDQIVGVSVARAYASHFRSGVVPSVVVMPDFDHHCCWVDSWPTLKGE